MKKNEVPTTGYILDRWEQTKQYRATALAYMQRENLKEVKHENGNTYTLEEVQKAIGLSGEQSFAPFEAHDFISSSAYEAYLKLLKERDEFREAYSRLTEDVHRLEREHAKDRNKLQSINAGLLEALKKAHERLKLLYLADNEGTGWSQEAENEYLDIKAAITKATGGETV